MKLRLKINKSVHENAATYYEEAKETREKIKGVEKAIEETKKELVLAEKEATEKKKQIKIKKEKKWHEKFHWFFTSIGKLAIGGKNAQQNDLLFAKHMESNDLFFHADIQGASAVILKDGIAAEEQELLEAAQFAACFSNAWKNANASVDVYAVRKEQLAKHSHGGFIAAGGFAIAGERKWFRSTKLELKIGIELSAVSNQLVLIILPAISKRKLENEVTLIPSKTGKEKGELAKQLAKRFGVHADELLQVLPNGRTKTKQ